MPFNTSNTNLTATALGISNPTYTASVSKITRVGSTATLTTSASPAITLPTSITLTGSASNAYNGSFAMASPTAGPASPATSTSVSWTVLELPVAAPTSTYTVSGQVAPSTAVTSITRTSVAGRNTATATVSDLTFGTGTNVNVGNTVTITGVTDTASSPSTSNPYNGAVTITAVNTATKQISYAFTDSPAVTDGGGTFCIGTKCAGSSVTGTIAPSNASPPGLVRGSSRVLMINFSTPIASTTAIANGNSVSITGTSAYVGNAIGTVTGTGSSCSVSYVNAAGSSVTYTGSTLANTTVSGKTTYNYSSVCVDISAAGVIVLTPAWGATQSQPATAQATLSSAVGTRAISSMTRGASNCPTTNNATVSVTTSTPHLFTNGETVTIAGTPSTPASNEAAYNGSFTITYTGTNTFTFQVPTSPPCSDSTSGMQISYQSSVGGIATSDLINWVRGDDNVGDEPSPPVPASPTLPITIRGSVHGDVLHSRPAVINYGGSTGVVVFYGANDGVFRAVNGNQPPATNTRPSGTVASTAATYTPMGSCALTGNSTCSIGGVAPGGELWGFIPSEFYSKLQRLYSNSPDLLLANTPSGIVPTPTPKDYFFDGPTATYQTYDSSGNTTGAYLFLTARRGGRVMYALDVSNPTAPKFMWRLTNATSGFSELGQTWSQPKVAFVKGYLDSNSKPKPVLIFGAGYDGNGYDSAGATYLGNDDKDPPTTNTMGRGIYIVDAMTGALVWSAGPGGSAATCSGNPCLLPAMTHSIAADITTVDTDLDGYVDRLYATDTGGNIWRVDLEAGAGLSTPSLVPSTWQVTRLAALGGTVTTASTRKFLFPPDVVVTKTFAAVLVGSGDREHPLSVQSGAYNTVNRFYMILDKTTGKDASTWRTVADDSNTSGAAASSQGTLFDASTQPFNITTSVCNGTAGACKGYYLGKVCITSAQPCLRVRDVAANI